MRIVFMGSPEFAVPALKALAAAGHEIASHGFLVLAIGPIGPWLVTRDEVPNPQALELWLDINGTPRQRSLGSQSSTRISSRPSVLINHAISSSLCTTRGRLLTNIRRFPLCHSVSTVVIARTKVPRHSRATAPIAEEPYRNLTNRRA